MQRLSARSFLLAIGFCFLAPGVGVSAAPLDDDAHEQGFYAHPIEVFFGVSFLQGGDQRFSSENRDGLRKIESTDHDVEIIFSPLKRALEVYKRSNSACLVHMPGEVSAGELESVPVLINKYWVYVPMESSAETLQDVKLMGSVSAAQDRLTKEELEPFEWLFTFSWESVVDLIRKRRVDAVTLGASAIETVENATAGLRRLSENPFTEIALTVHCKDTPHNAAYLRQLGMQSR